MCLSTTTDNVLVNFLQTQTILQEAQASGPAHGGESPTLPPQTLKPHPLCVAQVFVKDEKLTVGELQVEVVDCSRLVVMESAARTYCTVALGEGGMGEDCFK